MLHKTNTSWCNLLLSVISVFAMLKKFLVKITAYNSNLTVRIRLVVLTVAGLAIAMAVWGVIQLTVLDRLLVDQQVKRLENVAETVSTFYQ
ncbi:MAG: signal transduction histidine kinase, partial [Deltaproteobacteria bacterium]|nr:signal transduction histidine kinase [Deltaproteobacteria bacterium]